MRKTTNVIKNNFKQKLRKRCYFCSTDELFLKKIFEKLPVFKYKTQIRFKRSCFTWSIEAQEDVKSLQNYLYKNATIYLDRKVNKFNMTIKSEAKDTSLERLETT